MTAHRYRVLFVDDEIDNLPDHLEELDRHGFAVKTIRSTDDAIAEIIEQRARNFDLVILDMMLPPPVETPDEFGVWDGLRSGGYLLAMIRARAVNAPVLLLSHLDEDELSLAAWERFEEWCAGSGRAVPSATSPEELRAVLRQEFRVWFRAKRKTPPWALPDIAEQVIRECQGERQAVRQEGR